MKKNYKTMLLLTPILGTVGMLLRFWLLSTGYDEKGLLIAFHPASVCCWLLTFVMLGCMFLLTAGVKGMASHDRIFPASVPAAVFTALGAAGIGVNAISYWTIASNLLSRACCLLGIAAALCMAFAAFCRYRGKQPGFLPMTAVTVYFMLLLVCRYRIWMAEPQLDAYCFELLFTAGMMLTCFYHAALDDGAGNLGHFIRFGLATVFFAFLAIPGNENWFFIGSTGAFVLVELFTVRLPKRKRTKLQPSNTEGA